MQTDRSILHVDINSCYANIEILHRPELRGKPVVVGGDVEARHGIVLAKSQEAKPFGIKTGEVIWQAKQKCPGLIVLPPNYSLYLRFSRMIRALFAEHTDQVEPFGLDECWLDVTGSTHLFGGSPDIAEQIRLRVKRELGVTVSIGVSWNKIFAKLGSDMKKPDAVTVITKADYQQKVWPLPAEDLLYVGRATQRKLYSRGITTIGGIANTDPELLHDWFGKWGYVLHVFANGQDAAPVARAGDEAVIKSVGNSTTTPRDICNLQDAKIVFYNPAESVAARLREQGLKGRTIQIGVRDNTLCSFERQMKLPQPTCISDEICRAAMQLLVESYNWERPLRSIGVRAADLVSAQGDVQLSLLADEHKRERQEHLDRAVDDIRRRFGHYSIARAVMATDATLRQFDAKGDHTIHPVGYFA
jgi:DNA polymerase-4